MVKERTYSSMETGTLVAIQRVSQMERVSTTGWMAVFTRVSFKKVSSMEEESSFRS